MTIINSFPVGARYMVLSALGFALMTTCVKMASGYDIPLFEIVAVRAFVSLVISYLDIKRKGIALLGNNKPLLFARGAVGAFALICVYYAVTTLPLAESTILQYLHPVFTALLALFFLKEKAQPSTIACIVFCISGLIFIVKPSFLFGTVNSELPEFSVVMAILGAFCSAIAYVIVKKLSRSEDSSVIIFYFPFIALPVSLILLGKDAVLPDFWVACLLILIGIFTQIGQYGLTKAMQTEEAGKATAYAYIQIVFSIILGWICFNEIPSAWTWLGGSFIVIGALMNMYGSRFFNRHKGAAV